MIYGGGSGMSGKLYVPVMSERFEKHKDAYLASFREIGSVSPVLCIERTFDTEKLTRYLSILERNICILKENGYEPMVWAQAFGFGIPLDKEEAEKAEKFTRITDLDGVTLGDAMCPLDEGFMTYYRNLIQGAVKAGAKRIMLDDDLCLSVRPGLGCSCDKHLKMLAAKMNRPIDRATLKRELFRGEKSELRSAWLQAMGDTLIGFCKAVRGFADEINPDIEMGFCAGYTSWDIEGADALTVTKVLAGKNAPFMRLTGAPYWAELRRFDGQGMAQIVEFTRMQRSWCEGKGVEIFTENDSYPRPRYRVPAAVLETFDFMMAADSEIGQLKYLYEYYSSPEYETGYVYNHLRNRENRNRVQKIMGSMPSKGIYVHGKMRKVESMQFPDVAPNAYETMMTAFSHAADMLSSACIPITYEKHAGVAAAFGDSGRTVDIENHAGYIIDYPAALLLKKRGVDTGVTGGEFTSVPFTEKFPESDDEVLLDGCIRASGYEKNNVFVNALISEKAQIESVFPVNGKEIPASIRYENAQGQKFLVFLFDAGALKPNSGLSCSYYRQKQILDACEWMNDPVKAKIRKHPSMYMIVKEDDQKRAVALANFSLDPAYDVKIETDTRDSMVEFIGVSGHKEENNVIIDVIQPWSTGCIVIRK